MQEEILTWFNANKRDLPWRKSNPWGVMVSEFMLQQTPVARVLPLWHEWMACWPTPQSLADADKSDLIRAWGGLGYPRRVIRLHESAKKIVSDHGGEVPKNLELLRALPGVGEYTAAAIYSFAFNQRALVLDVNIRRVYARAIDGKSHAVLTLSNQERAARAELIPKKAALWAAASMELGALCCTAQSPTCEKCPIAQKCNWRSLGFPVSESPKRPTQSWHGTDRQCRGKVLALLRLQDRATAEDFQKIWEDFSQLERALTSLIKDGLIAKNGKKFALANG